MDQAVRDQVDIDLGRTFPENARYATDQGKAMQVDTRLTLGYTTLDYIA